MRDFPLFLHSAGWDEGLSFTPQSDDLFSSPMVYSGQHTPDVGNDHASPLRESSDSEEDIQFVRHTISLLTPPLQNAENGGATDYIVEAVDPTLNAAADVEAGVRAEPNTPDAPEPPQFFLIRLDPNRSYLFKDM